jgi:NADPH2:quinone reductase
MPATITTIQNDILLIRSSALFGSPDSDHLGGLSMETTAVRMVSVGHPDVLEIQQIPLAKTGPGQLKVRVLAAGFNPIDTKIRSGLAPIAPESGVLGCDLCGEVVEVGSEVSGCQVGDRVFGFVGGARHLSGALAKEVVVDANLVALAPRSGSAAEIACLPVTGITALEALGRLMASEGSRLLILGGSGGVGQLAVQIAKHLGLDVYATAGSSERCRQLEGLGATKAVLHSEAGQLLGNTDGFSYILDTFGSSSLMKALELAAPYGHVATINARGQHELAMAHAKSLTLSAIFIILPLLNPTLNSDQHLGYLNRLAQLVDDSVIRLPEVDVTPMTDVAEVHRQYEAGLVKRRVAFVWD